MQQGLKWGKNCQDPEIIQRIDNGEIKFAHLILHYDYITRY